MELVRRSGTERHGLRDAEEFAAGDPFVVAGTARVSAIRPWGDILGLG